MNEGYVYTVYILIIYEHARLVKGNVDRKVVKQTVMTSVYGVTSRGARDQVIHCLGFLK